MVGRLDRDGCSRIASRRRQRAAAHGPTRRSAHARAIAGKIGPEGMLLRDFLSAGASASVSRSVTYRHILGGSGVRNPKALPFSGRALPPDVCGLLHDVNGIHLWANAATGRSYQGLAPVEEWRGAREQFSPAPPWMDDRFVVISYHRDGAAYVVLDLESGTFFLMDSAGPDTTSPIASTVGELLAWIWKARLPPEGVPVDPA